MHQKETRVFVLYDLQIFLVLSFSLINWVFLFYQQAATEAANNKVKIRVGDGFLVWKGWLLIVGSIERGGICEFVNVAYVSVDDWYWYPIQFQVWYRQGKLTLTSPWALVFPYSENPAQPSLITIVRISAPIGQ